MRSHLVTALLVAIAVFAAPGVAAAQSTGPFGPLPPPQQEQPPPPQPSSSDDDGDFSGLEWLALGGIAVVLIGGAAWAIGREGRQLKAASESKKQRRRSGAPGGQAGRTTGGKKRSTTTAKKRAKTPTKKQRAAKRS